MTKTQIFFISFILFLKPFSCSFVINKSRPHLGHGEMIKSQIDLLGTIARTDFLNGLVDGVFAAIGVHEGLDGPAYLLGSRLDVGERLEMGRRLIRLKRHVGQFAQFFANRLYFLGQVFHGRSHGFYLPLRGMFRLFKAP